MPMTLNRRGLFRGALGVSAAVFALRYIAPAQAAQDSALAPLRALGLDPLAVYIRMFASMTRGAECAWWFKGALPRDVPDVGPVDTIQEETVRVHRTALVKPDQVDFLWKEVGVFRDVVTGENPPWRFDPVTGRSTPGATLLGGDSAAARISVRRDGDGLAVGLDIAGSQPGKVRIDATIEGDRVCLTHMEDKTRANPKGGMAPTNTTSFKIYANLGDLQRSAPSVAATGFYGVKNRDTGKVFVNGLMHKAALDDRVNPIAWGRIKAAYPGFFDGDRLAPGWED
jgi:hypothetical protein